MRLDKGSSVVAHWLVSSVWILDKDCIRGGENDHEEEYGGEDQIYGNKDYTHDTGHNSLRLVSINWEINISQLFLPVG